MPTCNVASTTATSLTISLPDLYLSVSTFAVQAGVPRRTAYYWIDKGVVLAVPCPCGHLVVPRLALESLPDH